MQIVIDIGEEDYERLKEYKKAPFRSLTSRAYEAIANGTPLPKAGHWEWLTENKYRCSNCKHETRVDECMSKPMYVFCPFCRTRMESEEE